MAKILRLPLILLVTSALGACGLIYKPTGSVLNHLAQDEVVPHVYASNDLDMSACGTGLGQTQLLGAFGRVMHSPTRVLLNTHTLAGLCSEAAAQKAQLHFDRRSARRGYHRGPRCAYPRTTALSTYRRAASQG